MSQASDIHSYGTFLEEKVKQRAHQRRQRRPSIDTRSWMSKIQDDVVLSNMSIPGTHDSAAYDSVWPFVSTQTMDILKQLNAGIRYFDFRCGLVDDVLQMVHGRAVLGHTLEEVLEAMYTFLEAQPKEGLLVQIKQDRVPENSDTAFPSAVWSVIDSKPQYWRTFPTTPRMADLRGKIQIFRRFEGPPYRGIDVRRWQDNPPRPFTIHTWSGQTITIQDHYNPHMPQPLPDFVACKGTNVSELLERANKDCDPNHWYINFASAYEFNWLYQCPPKQIAIGGYHDFRWVVGINPRLAQYLKIQLEKVKVNGKTKQKIRWGIIAMDFPEQAEDLIKSILKSNITPKKEKMVQPVHLMALFLLLIFLAGTLLVAVHGPVDRSKMWCPPFLHACVLKDQT